MPAGQSLESKPALRLRYRQERRRVDRTQRAQWDALIREALLALPGMVAGASIAAYWPFDGEPDLRPALETLHERGIRVHLPLIPNATGAGLEMHPWQPGQEMTSAALGVFQPGPGAALPVDALNIVLLPLVAWDRYGNRLGMGAGYYDRFLSPVSKLDRPLRAGVAYSVQRAEELPADPWDVPLHGLLCEEGWQGFNA